MSKRKKQEDVIDFSNKANISQNRYILEVVLQIIVLAIIAMLQLVKSGKNFFTLGEFFLLSAEITFAFVGPIGNIAIEQIFDGKGLKNLNTKQGKRDLMYNIIAIIVTIGALIFYVWIRLKNNIGVSICLTIIAFVDLLLYAFYNKKRFLSAYSIGKRDLLSSKK